jgi:hypothetical protein
MRKFVKAEISQAAKNKDFLSDCKEAYTKLAWDHHVINDNDMAAYRETMADFWNSLRVQTGEHDDDGNPIPVMRVGYDGKAYPQSKPYHEQLALCLQALDGFSEQDIKELAKAKRDERVRYEAARSQRQAEAYAAIGEDAYTGKPYANGDIYRAGFANERIAELESTIDRLQTQLDRNPKDTAVLKILDAKVTDLAKWRKRLSEIGEVV